jgi:hypothetical protein
MQSSGPRRPQENQNRRPFSDRSLRAMVALAASACVVAPVHRALGADANAATNSSVNQLSTTQSSAPADPVLGLMLEKGMITEDEATKVQAAVDARRTNMAAAMAAEYMAPQSKWNISKGIKNIELYGDLRLRYEDREATDPDHERNPDTAKHQPKYLPPGSIDLQRERYAFRVGVRGDAYDDFYYGFRMDTSSNPRSSWVTMGTSSSGPPYQGPYGKSTAGLDVGQIFLGWAPESWLDLTFGKMANPLYTSSMVWSPTINPEGVAEHLKYTVGEAELFANFAQFLYADNNPDSASGGLGFNGLEGQTANQIFQIAWQGGINYRIATNISAKVGATIYQYFGMQRSSEKGGGESPYFGDPYIGEGAYTGPLTANLVNGYSGYPTGSTLPGYQSLGYPYNQVGLDNLLVLEVPFEFNLRLFKKVDVRLFGDVAYNLEGSKRADVAAAAYDYMLSVQTPALTPSQIKSLTFAPQRGDNKAYQLGVAVGSKDGLGLVNGSTSKRHAWELRTYWQRVEQYSLDPNLIDADFMEGLENLQGFYVALAYGFSDNFIGTVRYGRATRINDKLGTGGSGEDIPQMNPVNEYNILQADLTFKF